MTYGAPNFPHIVHKPMPKNEIAFDLEPLAPTHRGFESRLPPVTEADHIAVGIAVNAKKPTAEWKDLELHYALEQQQHRGGAA